MRSYSALDILAACGYDYTVLDDPLAVAYRRLTDTRMTPFARSWEELVIALSVHREGADKLAGSLWSPVVPDPTGPHRRCNAAVSAVSAVVLDVDDGSPLETMVVGLNAAWIAYSTWGHTSEMPRYHLVVRLPVPVPADEWRETYVRFNAHQADWLPAVSHAYFVPQHAPGAPWFVHRSEVMG